MNNGSCYFSQVANLFHTYIHTHCLPVCSFVMAPLSPPPNRTGPSSPPPDRTGPSSPPPDRTGPSSPPPDRTGPSSPPPDRTGPSSPPPDRTGPQKTYKVRDKHDSSFPSFLPSVFFSLKKYAHPRFCKGYHDCPKYGFHSLSP